MGFERLYKNLIDIIKEEQAKLCLKICVIHCLNHFETEDTEEQMKPEFVKCQSLSKKL